MKKGRLKGKHLLYPSLKMKIITTLFQEQLLRGIDKYQIVIPIGFTHFSFYKELKQIIFRAITYYCYCYEVLNIEHLSFCK